MLSKESYVLDEKDIVLEYPVIAVKDIEGMLSFYRELLGLEVMTQRENVYFLSCSGNSRPIIALEEVVEGSYPSSNEAGLYHYAILLPDRKSLASTFLFLQERGIIFDGFADHLVSEALYLHDPERNGIEIYADRPREVWRWSREGTIAMSTLPLNIASLTMEAPNKPRPLSPEARIGHIHLRVTNLERSISFYSGVLGLTLKARMHGAAFLSLGSYHHHFGLNTWETLGGVAKQRNTTGLKRVVISASKRYMDKLFSSMHNDTIQVEDPDKIIVNINLKEF